LYVDVPMGEPAASLSGGGDYIASSLNRRDLGINLKVTGTAHSTTYNGAFAISGDNNSQNTHPVNATHPVYYGPLDNEHGPIWSSWRYQSVIGGVLGVKEIPIYRVSLSGVEALSFIMMETWTLTVNDASGPRTYYLDSTMSPYSNDVLILRNFDTGDHIYIYGESLDYFGPDGRLYMMLHPDGVSGVNRGDPVELAMEYLSSKVGGPYFTGYFSRPSAFQDADNSTIVGFYYNVTVGSYSESHLVQLNLNSDYKVTDSYGIPPADNLQPYNVTMDEAVGIARAAGVPSENFEFARIIFESSESVKGLGVGGRYVWAVSALVGRSDDVWSVRRIAFIDPSSGKVYDVVDWNTFMVT
jgi:hypothetical protein